MKQNTQTQNTSAIEPKPNSRADLLSPSEINLSQALAKLGRRNSKRVSDIDNRRIEFLKREVIVRNQELGEIFETYFEVPMKVVVRSIQGLKSSEAEGLIFINDGNGNCGVWDEGTGTCGSVDC